MGRKILIGVITCLYLIFASVFVLGAPNIQIVSPTNTTYSGSKILLNVTSDETVDFFVKERGGEYIPLKTDASGYVSNFFVKQGGFKYTIWANNSNGTTNATISFGSSFFPNPINITACGSLLSSDTKYILRNNITGGGRRCLTISGVRNATVLLHNFSITNTFTGRAASALRIVASPNTKILGYGRVYTLTNSRSSYAVFLSDSSVLLKDLNIYAQNGGTGMITFLEGLHAENIYINGTTALHNLHLRNAVFRNLTIDYFNDTGDDTAIKESSIFGEVIFENTTIDNRFDFHVFHDSEFTTYFVRNSNIDQDKIGFDTDINPLVEHRFYIQHLVKCNVTDGSGSPVSAIISVQDDGTTPELGEDEKRYESVFNPDSGKLVATNESGIADIWIAESLGVHKTGSPLTTEIFDFSPYNLTARSRNITASEIVNFSSTNSTLPVSFSLSIEEGGSVSDCTLEEMFDLNNDTVVDINDAILILRSITNKSIDVGTSKECKALSFSAGS